uniref:non-specific serine/threonine protein kinase n=1 Tax=Ananas comosus var. bracteatus TaxID=296719 RepID=A0A6V7QAD3_ANACO|nr:unnamed protein product [Ananas comosus var. bracteatus]
MTARVFSSPYTYSFPLGPGRKFVRLYFYPASYSTALPRTASSPSLQARSPSFPTFCRPNRQCPKLCLPHSGILRQFHPVLCEWREPDRVHDRGGHGLSTTMYRLNVGGQAISPVQDSGLYRSWDDDSLYIFGLRGVTYGKDPNVDGARRPHQSQLQSVVDTYGRRRFYYLVRLHFCEIQYPITKVNQRVFDIYLNNQTAQEETDVIALSGGIGVPVYEDFVVVTAGSGLFDLWVALHPDVTTKPEYYDAILNGLEVFKMQNSGNSLAGLNPPLRQQPDVDPSKAGIQSGSKSKVAAIVGGIIGGFAALCLGSFCLFFLCRRQKKKGKDMVASDGPSGWLPLSLYGNSHSAGSAKTNTTGSYASSLPSNLCRHFSFAEIQAATNGFDEALLLGVGGFGKVYRGEVDNGSTKVAIKRGNPLSEQGVHEFQTEIEMLSKLRHRHLVSLIGYCEEKNEMILVYDYMAHGTLREHLYKTQKPPLPWKQRLEICIGAARGLHYLHTGAKHTIIHRDVKTTNILLDEKWVAKVSDFGLSKTGPTLDHTHVSTVVKAVSVLCARPALNPTLPKEQVSLAEWALHCQKKGILDQISDPYLKGKIAPQCFKKFAETAEKCVADVGIERPSMGDVLWNLEFALQLQESAEESGSLIGGMSDEGTPLMMASVKKGSDDPLMESTTTTTTTTTTTSVSIGGRSVASEDSDGLTPSAVFSQIMNPKGR